MNPLCDLLASAQAHDANVRKSAEAQLLTLATKNTFWMELLNIIASESVENNTRLLGAIYLKNMIRKHWKRSDFLAPDEKESIRRRLCTFFSCNNKLVNEQVFQCVAVVAKLDWPRGEFQTLFSTLFEHLSISQARTNSNTNILLPIELVIHEQNVLCTMNKVLKALLWLNVPEQRSKFTELVAQILPVLVDQMDFRLERTMYCWKQLFVNQSDPNPACVQGIVVAKVFLKCLFHCLETKEVGIVCCATLQFRDFVFRLLDNIERWVPSFLDALDSFHGESKAYNALNKCHATLIRCITTLQAISFRAFLPKCVPYFNFFLTNLVGVCSMVHTLIKGTENDIQYISMHREKPSIFACQYLCRVVEEFHEHTENEEAAHLVSFLSKKVVLVLLDICLCFMSFSAKDVQEWEEYPELFLFKQETIKANESLPAVAESLYLSLLEQFEDVVAPVVVETLQRLQSTFFQDPGDNPWILASKLDGLYLAVSLFPYKISRYMSYEKWFINDLIPILNSCVQTESFHRSHLVVVLRIFWSVGCISGELSDQQYRLLHPVFLNFLEHGIGSPGGNITVRISAVMAFHALVERCGFGHDKFTSQDGVLRRFLNTAYSVMNDAVECDSRARILAFVALVVERVDQNGILEHIDIIVSPLVFLWHLPASQSVLRNHVLSILMHVVEVVGPSPAIATQLHQTVLPLISYSTDNESGGSASLVEDGIALWNSVMKHTPVYTQDLHKLFLVAPAMVRSDTSRSLLICNILSSYIVVGGSDFCCSYSSVLLEFFEYFLTELKPDAVIYAMHTVDLLIRCCPHEGPRMLESVIRYVFDRVIENALLIHKNEDTITPCKRESDKLIAAYISLVARILIQSPDVYKTLVSEWHQKRLAQSSVCITSLLTLEFLRLYPVAGGGTARSRRRKLWGLCLCTFLSEGWEIVLIRGNTVVQVFLDLTKLCDVQDTQRALFEKKAKRQEQSSRIDADDIVHSCDLKAKIKMAMDSCSHRLGIKVWNALANIYQVDHDKLQELMHALDLL
jgi:hypothetical protein